MNISNYDFIIHSDTTLINAMKLMDTIKRKLLIVMAKNKYIGLLSIGDVQRAIINNISLSVTVASVMRNDYFIAKPNQSIEGIKKLMLNIRAEFMPVVDDDRNLVHIFFWKDLFGDAPKEIFNKFDLPIIIMAGGKGTRLKPLTNVIPKPLIPIDEKTIIEHIFEKFAQYGCNNFFISVNYKAELIEYYLTQQNLSYIINYFKEKEPMGTAGSLSLLKEKISSTFFVSNCDILIDQDYSEILKFHYENKNEVTIVAALKTFPIKYGTIETGKNGRLIKLLEKPELIFKINSGMYILEPHILNEIPSNKFFHMTKLIDNVNRRGGIIGVFPVNEKSWKDIGTWEEYFQIFS